MKLHELGELGLISRIRERTGPGRGVLRGIGDDAAQLEIESGLQLLTSTDLLIEQTHFDFSWTTPEDLGYKAVAVAGDLACVVRGDFGMLTVDVHDPSAPVRVGYVENIDNAFDVAIEGTHAYVADGEGGMLVFDIATPAAPVAARIRPASSRARRWPASTATPGRRSAISG
mgnify:CR=1 FL=1